MAPKHIILAVFGCIVGGIGSFYWKTREDPAPPSGLTGVLAGKMSLDYRLDASSKSRELDAAGKAPDKGSTYIEKDWSALIENEIKKDDSNRDEAGRLLGAWLDSGPDDAIYYILASSRDADFVWINGTISEYFQKGEGYPGKMTILARLDNDPRIMKGLLGTALVAWARDDHSAALKWLNQKPRSPERESAASALGNFVGESGKTCEILEQVNLASLAPEIKKSYLSGLVRKWSSHDLVNASEWLNHNNHRPEVDGVIPELVVNAVANNVEFAMIWAESIRDEELRATTILDTAKVWRERDKDAYLQWKHGLVAQNFALVGALPPD
jgi:hypothetical protein